ncbi:hypothetical protein PHYBOEH_004570 [Phytophthora boehmeriae]|uniref:WW domain-containing protein n=1 Tax=Phytophthora boehmeriae TaxID=109152 RepID=A0A8T1X610_9STRA|nr:hypothetical protein PHYBOEH_004570 [Phytophthora boehmeriae]
MLMAPLLVCPHKGVCSKSNRQEATEERIAIPRSRDSTQESALSMEQNASADAEAQIAPPAKPAVPVEATQPRQEAATIADTAETAEEKDESATADEEKEMEMALASAQDTNEPAADVTMGNDAPEEQDETQTEVTVAESEDTAAEQVTAPPEATRETEATSAATEAVTEDDEAVVKAEKKREAEEEQDDATAEEKVETEEPSTPNEEDAMDAAVLEVGNDNGVEVGDVLVEQEPTTVEQQSEAIAQDTEQLEEPLPIVAPIVVSTLQDVGESAFKGSDQPTTRMLVLDTDVSEDLMTSGATPVSGDLLSNLLTDEAVATPEGYVQMHQELNSPAAMPDFVAEAEENGANTEEMDAELKQTETEHEDTGEKSEGDAVANDDEHATISAVPEAAEKTPMDANLEGILERIRNKLPCESVEVLDSGEIMALPKGWSTRQSKTNDGKTYYVSPYGHTQWLRPPMKTGVIYNWVHQIEVTFGPGRLGLNLKQIAGIPGTEFTDLQVHIAEIYKLPNGMASPAEIYNWSVKPEKRLAVNMRVTMMNNISLAGYTYSEVLELLARLQRPIRIKFADCSKGIVGRVEEEIPHEEKEEVKEARAARVMQNSLRMEYFQIMVSYELHKQVWAVTKNHMRMKFHEVEKKSEILSSQIEEEGQRQLSLEKERENFIQETASLKEMIKQLDQQTAGEIESLEVVKSAELAKRTSELEKEVSEIIAENDELQASRAKIEESLDALQKELDQYGDLDVDLNGQYEIKFFSPAFLGSMVHRGSIDTRAEDAHERLLGKIKAQRDHLEEEIKMEEDRAKFVESEIHQFQNQMDVAAAAVKREDEFISGERPPQVIFLENKIALLKKNLRETVAGITKATKSGDQQQADNLSLRRADLKDDLKAALDEMQRMESELKVFFDLDEGKSVAVKNAADDDVDTVNIDEAPHERLSESSRLQNKLTRLQAQLHDTVVQLAKAASEKDEVRKGELSKRRLQLKDEMKVVQDHFQALTNATLNAVKSKDSMLRPSIAGPPMMLLPRGSSGSSRASLGGIRASLGGSRASLTGIRSSMGGNKAGVSAQRGSEQLDPPRSHRSSSSASIGSMTSSVESNSNQIPRDGSLPRMSGLLRKHPTHSNEKGTFGNMSLRGVRERWCNIESDGFLRYYKREGDREPRGAIPLKHKSLEILHGKQVGKLNEFMICSPTHQTRLIAKTQEEMLRWVKVLELAHKYFMQQSAARRGSTDGHRQESMSPAGSAENAASTDEMDPELAYRNQRATLGF